MVEIVLYVLLFIMGIYFGSFFTLAVYRIPKKENILYKHSYCPNCNHKLGILDLIPVFSYIFLNGKCRYCKQKIRPRYFLLEIFTGVVFVIYAISLKLNFYELEISSIIKFLFEVLYFSGLFIIAGIDKESKCISKPILVYQSVIAIGYILYSWYIAKIDIITAIIYLSIFIILYLLDILILKKKLSSKYALNVLMLCFCMTVMSSINIIIVTILLTILALGITNIAKIKKKEHVVNKPIGYYLCVCNIISIIMFNIICNYILI